MCKCKRCGGEDINRNGKVRERQRYRCKDCGYTYVEGDTRINKKTEGTEGLVLLIYSTGKGSYRFIARLLGLSSTTVYRWIKSAAKRYKKDNISGKIKEIEIDEMWHYIQKKAINAGYLKQLIEEQENVLHGLQDKETLRQCISCIRS